MNLNQRIHLAAFRGWPFLVFHEELALLSVWKPQDVSHRDLVWALSWNGLRPAGMQLNGTNAQKEWQASSCFEWRLDESKALRTSRLEDS